MSRYDQPPPDDISEWTALAGYHLEWVPSEGWEVTNETRKCRRPGCQRPTVARFLRRNGWWHYCDWHLYGRKIVDAEVLGRRAAPDDESMART